MKFRYMKNKRKWIGSLALAMGMMLCASHGMEVKAETLVDTETAVVEETLTVDTDAVMENNSSAMEEVQTDATLYMIAVNRVANCVTVYTKDEMGNYTVPVRSFACSCGAELDYTPLGIYTTSNYYDWRLMVDGTYAQYAIRFNGPILFPSVPQYTKDASNLEWEQFNLLGSSASLGCVRLAVSDVKWLYENCPQGTLVMVYDDAENPGPLGKPVQVQIAESSLFKGWDPTDDNPLNPWLVIKPELYLRETNEAGEFVMPLGSTIDELQNIVGMQSKEGLPFNPADYTIYMNGSYNLNVEGSYRVWVTGIDIYGRIVEEEMTLKVVDMQVESEVVTQ